jgi:hypothetical protein
MHEKNRTRSEAIITHKTGEMDNSFNRFCEEDMAFQPKNKNPPVLSLAGTEKYANNSLLTSPE